MKKAATFVRYFLGIVFTFFGLNGFFGWVQPPAMQQEAMNLMMAFVESGYLLPFVKGTEVACGILFLSGCFVPLAIVVIFPVVLNIVAIHLFLDPGGVAMGIVLLLATSFLAWAYRGHYAGLFSKKAQPTV